MIWNLRWFLYICVDMYVCLCVFSLPIIDKIELFVEYWFIDKMTKVSFFFPFSLFIFPLFSFHFSPFLYSSSFIQCVSLSKFIDDDSMNLTIVIKKFMDHSTFSIVRDTQEFINWPFELELEKKNWKIREERKN